MALLPWGVHAREITVSAAASLQNAFRDIGASYQRANPGRQVHFNFAASGALLAQITQGAPVDVLATADVETMDKAQARGLLKAGTRVDFAANELVLVSPRSRSPGLSSIADLRRPDITRIAVGTPSTVPAGRYAREALEQRGLWSALAPKFVFAENVRQALSYVSRAEADAGLVYRTDALIEQDQVRIDLAVPTATPVVYPMAVVGASTNAGAAADFISFVTGAPGRAVLTRYGFSPAPQTPAQP